MLKKNSLFNLASINLAIITYLAFLYTKELFAQGIFVGIVLSYMNIKSTQIIAKFFTETQRSKSFIFILTILKITVLAGIAIYVLRTLSIDLIGFLVGFSAILIVFILLNQGK
jgi:hypothetical protein